MNGLKALIIGIVTIIILGLLVQVAVLLAEVGYNSLSNTYSILDPYKNVFVYSIVAIGFALVMICGGYVTAAVSRQKIYLYSSIAAFTACGISLWSSLVTEIFTPIAVLFLIYGISFSLLGSWLWKKTS